MSHNRDLLSEMPDEILHHILSFLPTRQSVRTSILSRRWRHLWRCVPTLHFDFDDRSPAIDASESLVPGKELSHVIDQFLALRDAASSLLRFHLRLHIYDHFQLKDLVSKWISYARSHGVRDMTVTVSISWLNTHHRGPPLHIFLDLPSVERLYVMNTYSVTSDKLPQQIALGKLKVLTLHTTAMSISDQNLTMLLSSCPALQELTLYHAKYNRGVEICSPFFFGEYNRTIEIKVPTLRRLSITNEHNFDKPGLEITCPSLEYFRLSNMAHLKHFQGHMPSLFEASITLAYFRLNVADHFQQICVSLRGVTKLTLHLEADKEEKTLLNQIRSCPIFHKLKQFTFKAWLKENYFKEALLEFLLLCPNLVSLELVCASNWIDRISSSANIVEECTQQERIPGVLEHLKTVYLRGISDERFRGDVLEMLSMRASKWESVMHALLTEPVAQ